MAMSSSLEADRVLIAQIASLISELEASIRTLRDEQKAAQNRLDSYKYPVLTLPNELVSEIFINFLPDSPASPKLTGTSSPQNLAQICRSWREIALGTPELWRTMQLDTTQQRGLSLERQVQICDSWLARCLHCSVSIGLRLRHTIQAIDDVLAPLHLHRARLEDLKLHFWEEVSSLPLLEGPIPCLRHLDLQFRALSTNFTLHDLPLLRSVILNSVAALNVELPWSQLTSITLRHTTPQLFLPILRHASSLIHCTLELADSDPLTPGTANVALMSLESLTFADDTVIRPLREYLRIFVAPALRALRIPEQCLGAEPIQVLQAFISQSECKLTELCVTDEITVIQDLNTYREVFPSISRLVLDGWIVDDDLDKDDIYEVDDLELLTE